MTQYTYQWNYGKPVWATQKDEAYIREAYNKVVWVYACVAMIASCTSSVPWVLYRKRGGKLNEIPDHPILNIVNNRVNPWLSSRDFFDLWATYLALQGKFYAEMNNPTIPTQLSPIYPHFVSPVPDKKQFVSGFEFQMGSDKIIYPADSVIWSKFNDPLDLYQGLSPIRAMARTIDTENQAVDWNKTTLQNAAVPPGAISAVNISPETKEKLREDWLNRYGGSNNARVPLLLDAERIQYTSFGLSPVDMDFLNQRKLNRIEICSAFGVPGQVVGDPEGQTYANYEEALKSFWQNTIVPRYLDNIKSTLNSDLVARYADNLVLDYNLDDITVLHESIDAISDRVTKLFVNNIITREEAREALGYEAEADGEYYAEVASKILQGGKTNPVQTGDDADQSLTETDDTLDDGETDRVKKNLKSVDMTEEQKALYWKAYEGKRSKYYSRLESKVKGLFDDERKKISSVEAETYSVYRAQVNAVISKGQVDWRNTLTAAYIAIIDDFGSEVYRDLESKKAFGFSVFAQAIMQFVSSTVAEMVVNITDTTKTHIKQRIDEGITEGMPIAKIAKWIDNLYLDEIIPNRSKVIAQTETIRASNYGSYAAAQQASSNVKKIWIPTYDQRTRDTHFAMGAHAPVDMDGYFTVGDSRMQYPGDPNGSAKETINCRCAIGYVRK
jgi:HK97 family phage portal protein